MAYNPEESVTVEYKSVSLNMQAEGPAAKVAPLLKTLGEVAEGRPPFEVKLLEILASLLPVVVETMLRPKPGPVMPTFFTRGEAPARPPSGDR